MPLTSVAEIRLFFEEIQNVIRELIFLCTWGTEYETLRSLTAWFVDKTKFNELIEGKLIEKRAAVDETGDSRPT